MFTRKLGTQEETQPDLHSSHTPLRYKEKALTFPGWTLCSESLGVCLQEKINQTNQVRLPASHILSWQAKMDCVLTANSEHRDGATYLMNGYISKDNQGFF